MSEPQNEKDDIFDILMHTRPLRFAEPFYKQHKEGLLYLFFGGVTTLVNFVVYYLLYHLLGMELLLANSIAWAVSVLVAFLTNRSYVFSSSARTALALLWEFISFCGSRVATLLLEDGFLFVFVTLLALPPFAMKVAASILVVVSNYVLSKLIVFRKKKTEDAPDENGTL